MFEEPSRRRDRYARLRSDLVDAVARVCPQWLAGQAEDIVQLALLRLVEVDRRREEKGGFSSSYIKKTAYSAVVDEIRRCRRRGEVTLEPASPAAEPSRPEPDPERCALDRELGRQVRSCLEGMLPPRRRAVTLHLLGHTIAEVGRIEGWDVKKADNLIYRGLADLRECLEKRGVRR